MKEFRLTKDQLKRIKPFFSDKTNILQENSNNGMRKVSLKYKKVVKMLWVFKLLI